jgi:AraC family transcriptional regulator
MDTVSLPPKPVATKLCRAEGWSADDIWCTAGPQDRPFEERHSHASIAIVLGGTFTYRSEHGRHLMSAGSLLLGNAGKCFECGHEHSRGDHCLAFHFDPEALEEMAAQIGSCRSASFAAGRLPPHADTLPVVSAAQRLRSDPDPLLAQEVAFDLARLGLAATARRDVARVLPRDEGRIADLLHFIEDHLADPLSLEVLAEVAGVGRFHVLRTFGRIVGETPYAYILNRRLQASAALLRETPARITQAAFDTGFGDISEFTRHFAKRYRCTPGDYRRRFAGRKKAGGPRTEFGGRL